MIKSNSLHIPDNNDYSIVKHKIANDTLPGEILFRSGNVISFDKKEAYSIIKNFCKVTRIKNRIVKDL